MAINLRLDAVAGESGSPWTLHAEFGSTEAVETAPRTLANSRWWVLLPLAAVYCLSGWGGCANFARQIVPCPLTYSEQEREVLTIVPKGTPRVEVLRRLNAAGIEGNFATSQRIYYCDLWKRANGERWQMNLALLFDDYGKLYKTRVADCDVTAVRDETAGPIGMGTPEPLKPKDTATAAAPALNADSPTPRAN